MKGTVLIAATVLAGCTSVLAQEPPAAAPVVPPPAVAPQTPLTQTPTPTQTPAPPQAPAGTSQMSRERLQRIYHIRQLEGNLTNAVRAGATTLASQLQAEPNSLFVTSNARARGFELEGYGVFFDVDVPTIMPSVLWSSQMLQQQMQDVAQLRAAVADQRNSPGIRRVAEMELRRLEKVLGLAPSPAFTTQQAAPQGLVVATSNDATLSAAPVAPPPDTRDPNEIYTEAIKSKLIDAMLSYTKALQIADDEWLTVAARATNQGLPGTLDDASSIVLRIKGSDLTAFLTGKISREDAIKRVEIKES